MMHPDPRLQNIAPGSALRDPVTAVPATDTIERVCTAMKTAVTEVFDDCLDALFYTACAAADQAAHRRCIEAVRELRARQAAISAAFLADIRRLLETPTPGSVVVPFASLHSGALEGELADTLQMILKRADERDAATRDSGIPTLPTPALTARRSVESFVRCCGELHIERELLLLLLDAFEHAVVARLPALRSGLSTPGGRISSRHAGSGTALHPPSSHSGPGARTRQPSDDSIPETLEDKTTTPETEEVSRLIARFKAGGLKLPHASVADQLCDIASDDDDTTAAPPPIERQPTQHAAPRANPRRLATAVVVSALLVAAALKLMFSDPAQSPSEQYDVASLDAIVSAAAIDAASEPLTASWTEPLSIPAQPAAATQPVDVEYAAEAVVAADTPPLVVDSAEVARAQTPPPVVVDARLAQQARYLVQRAEVALRERRLTTPFEDSAWANYLAVLAIDPNDAQAHTGLQRIVEQYRRMIRNALERGDRHLAGVFLERAQSVAPEAPELESLRLEIAATY